MIEVKDLNFIETVVTWIVGAIGLGRVYGVLSEKVKSNEKDITDVKGDIRIIKQEFVTGDGDQRLMSFSAHDKLQETCQSHMRERISSLTIRLDKHDEKLDKILEAVKKP